MQKLPLKMPARNLRRNFDGGVIDSAFIAGGMTNRVYREANALQEPRCAMWDTRVRWAAELLLGGMTPLRD